MAESILTRRGAGGGKTKIEYVNGGTSITAPQKLANATDLSSARYSIQSRSLGTSYAFFAGGYTGSATNSIDVYDTSLVKTSLLLTVANQASAASSNDSYIIFAGGYTNSFSSAFTTVNAFNTSLTRTTPTGLSEAKWFSNGNGGSAVGNYLLIGGGANTSGSQRSSVNAYDLSLTRTSPTDLSASRSPTGSETSAHALFVGGQQTGTVDAYDTSLTRSLPGTLPTTVGMFMGGAKVNNNALFAGGRNNSDGTLYTTVYSFNTSLTRNSLAALSEGRRMLYGGSSNYNKAMFSGGQTSSSRTNAVDAYNTSLTKDSVSYLTTARDNMAAAGVGEYHLVAGGWNGNYINSVEVYSTTVGYQLVTPALSNFVITYNYSFSNIGTGTIAEGATLSSSTAFTGYLEFPEEIT